MGPSQIAYGRGVQSMGGDPGEIPMARAAFASIPSPSLHSGPIENSLQPPTTTVDEHERRLASRKRAAQAM